jgi:hypothetical protein
LAPVWKSQSKGQVHDEGMLGVASASVAWRKVFVGPRAAGRAKKGPCVRDSPDTAVGCFWEMERIGNV